MNRAMENNCLAGIKIRVLKERHTTEIEKENRFNED
jgi:hypothetical protein